VSPAPGTAVARSPAWPAASGPARAAWLRCHARSLGACLIVVAVAALLRTVQLTTVPQGLHGDEAAYGLEGERILREGWIGPYSGINLGLPSGPLYPVALAVGLFGNTILAVRIGQALCGALTVLVLYVVVARNIGPVAATVAAAVLATLAWHVHLSRVGFSLATWTLCVVVAMGALVEAIRRRDWRWWLAAGAAAGAGVYVYNAHVVVLAILLGYLALHLVAERWCPRLVCPKTAALERAATPTIVGITLFVAAVVITAVPMLQYALDPRTGFFSHYQAATLGSNTRWQAAEGPSARLAFLVSEYGAYWRQVCCQPAVDGVDGTGVTPLAPLGLLALAALGLGYGLAARRQPLVVLSALLVFLLPVAAVLTGLDAAGRRTVALAPILALFAGLGVAELLRAVGARSGWWREAGTAALALAVAALAYQGLTDYFVRFAGSSVDRGVFVRELTDASLYLRTLPAGSRVYFYASRWSVNYETRRYLAPNVDGEDRSLEFGGAHTGIDVVQSGTPSVFVLLGDYRRLLPSIQARYPGGTLIQGGSSTDPTFVAYQLGGEGGIRTHEGGLGLTRFPGERPRPD
jgi:4-amino-4-deoxy-L-arabinose transferase-like glycosyltransferase